MRAFTLLLLLAVGAAFPSEAASDASKSSKAKATSKSKSSIAKSSKKKAVARKPKYSTQQSPTSDRYREIQQALIDKGFLEGEATGEWNQQSIDALKKFEQSQKLREDGKIDSMSLIALGLGPARTQDLNAKPDSDTSVDHPQSTEPQSAEPKSSSPAGEPQP